ncbi:hypothetical protein NN3_40960 [Nocardia neocaledoniensis NBRC 108232]|nr:hypothetical protein NN3_40960 [Nocardia neocaledoniensis NBRC 108232]
MPVEVEEAGPELSGDGGSQVQIGGGGETERSGGPHPPRRPQRPAAVNAIAGPPQGVGGPTLRVRQPGPEGTSGPPRGRAE